MTCDVGDDGDGSVAAQYGALKVKLALRDRTERQKLPLIWRMRF
jgi:hypothetical protein